LYIDQIGRGKLMGSTVAINIEASHLKTDAIFPTANLQAQ